LDAAKAEISRCQDAYQERQRKLNVANTVFFAEWIAGIIAGIVSLALTIRFRAKIAAGLYNSFIGCLALRLRFNRSRKRFLDNAIKQAENRLG
jgi:hypothetical protein